MCVLTSDIFRTHLFTFQMYQQQSRHKDEYFISGHYYCWLAISSRVCVRISTNRGRGAPAAGIRNFNLKPNLPKKQQVISAFSGKT
jgi:hypothetical protein